MSDCKLVPMEPTAEMVSEGARSLRIMSLPEREAASVFRAMLAAAPNMQGEPLRYTNDGALAECPCCGSLDVGGAHDTVHCYSCDLTVTKPRPLQNAIDAWNTRTGRTHPAPDVQGEPVAYISHTSEGDFLGWERQFDAPSHTPLYNTPQPAPSAPVGVEGLPKGWMRDRKEVVELAEHLEGEGWRQDERGDVQCFDQGSAMAAEVIRHVLIPILDGAQIVALAQQPAAVDEVHELRLCESSRLHLFPGRLYRFTVDPDCKMCADAASNCDLAQQPAAELWCLHILGPDEVHAAPSKAHAEKAATWFNERFAKDADTTGVLCRAEVAPWPHSPESHAEDVGRFISDWLVPQKPAAVDGAAVRWAVERWNDEVANRPLVNVYRRTLDGTWRQVIRHFGGDDVTLCGPRHDDLAAQQGGES